MMTSECFFGLITRECRNYDFRSQFSSSVYISGWSRISFLSHLKIKPLLRNVVVISQKVSHTSAAFPGRLKKKNILQIKAEAVAQRSLQFSTNSYFFVLAELSRRSSSLWYGIQTPRTIARTYLTDCIWPIYQKPLLIHFFPMLDVHIYMHMKKNKEAV